MRDLDLGEAIVPAESLRAVTSRSGGPGGQNVNKVESRVTIEIDVDALPLPDDRKARVREKLASRINRDGVLRVTSQAARSQIENRDRALTRMEELLRESLVEQKPRKKTRMPKAVKERRSENSMSGAISSSRTRRSSTESPTPRRMITRSWRRVRTSWTLSDRSRRNVTSAGMSIVLPNVKDQPRPQRARRMGQHAA